MTRESAKLRWLLARITGPVRGTFSSPVTLGRHTILARGGTTVWRTPYITGPSVAVTRGSADTGPLRGHRVHTGPMADSEIQHRIKSLIDEEHRLRTAVADGDLSPGEEYERLSQVEVE